MKTLMLAAAAALVLAAPALAQQADPAGFNTTYPYLTAWDGSHFQVLKTLAPPSAAVVDDQGNTLRPALPAVIETDQTATKALADAYVAAHPQPAPAQAPATP